MAPYLLLGFGVAAALSVLVPPNVVEKHLGRKGAGSVFKASLFGVPLPLCSCGVIPVAASLREHGASKGCHYRLSALYSTDRGRQHHGDIQPAGTCLRDLPASCRSIHRFPGRPDNRLIRNQTGTQRSKKCFAGRAFT